MQNTGTVYSNGSTNLAMSHIERSLLGAIACLVTGVALPILVAYLAPSSVLWLALSFQYSGVACVASCMLFNSVFQNQRLSSIRIEAPDTNIEIEAPDTKKSIEDFKLSELDLMGLGQLDDIELTEEEMDNIDEALDAMEDPYYNRPTILNPKTRVVYDRSIVAL
jgi:hypothetical protein